MQGKCPLHENDIVCFVLKGAENLPHADAK
jgi:hypothetical protein